MDTCLLGVQGHQRLADAQPLGDGSHGKPLCPKRLNLHPLRLSGFQVCLPVHGPGCPPAGLVALPVALPASFLGKVGADEGAEVPLFLVRDAEQGNQGVVLGGVEGRQLAAAKLDPLACLECLCFAVEGA